jgi:hypothetical protein
MATESTGSLNLTIYKSTSLENAKNRNIQSLSESQKVKATTTVSNFIAYMKNKHL